MSLASRLAAHLPLIQHLKIYRRIHVYDDLIAGSVTATLLVP